MSNKILNVIDKASWAIVVSMGTIICAGLGITSFFVLARMRTEEFSENIPELLDVKNRNFIIAFFSVALLSLALLYIYRLIPKFLDWKSARIVALIAAVGMTTICFVWMNSFANAPASDQEITWNVARQLAGIYSVDEWIYEYLRLYPFQAGMAMVMEIFIRIFGDSCWSWQVFSALSAGVCVYILSCICARITNKPGAKCICATLLLGCLPLAMYSTFIYGTLPGIALALLGIYAIIRENTSETRAILWWILAVLSFTISIIIYTGNQIFLVAALLVLIKNGITNKHRKKQILLAIALLLIALKVCNVWQGIAMNRMGLENETGCPILPRILMGVDAYSEVPAPGFCNGISIKVYRECNYNAAEANRICVGHIRNSLVALHKQGRFLAFFCEKTADQWLEPWFGGLTMSNPAIYNEPNWLAQGLLDNTLFPYVNFWLSTLLSFIYVFGAMGTIVVAQKNKNNIAMQILSVCLIGGFLFQLASEAKSRYCLPYYLCCFPLAAAGIAALAEKLGQRAAVRKAGQK